MTLGRWVLALSSLPFLGIGVAFLFWPAPMASRVGLTVADALADNDVRAVYGGMQLGIGSFLALSATRPAWVVPGLTASLLAFGGLAAARVLSIFVVGEPGSTGLLLHAGEALGIAAAAFALARTRRTGASR